MPFAPPQHARPQSRPQSTNERKTGAGQPPQLVAVPTHFYKVILGEGPHAASGSSPDTVVAAFVLPNQPIEPGAPLTAFAVPVSALEEVSGVRPA